MKKFFTYFDFSKTEKRGFLVLITLVFIIQLIPNIYSYFETEEKINYKIAYLEEENNKLEQYSDSNYSESKSYKSRNEKNIKYFDFNPNTITDEKWEELGLSTKQIKVIRNYLIKGGRFYKKEDLKKIYSITDKDYDRLENYITIAKNENKQNDFPSNIKIENHTAPQKKRVININIADTIELMKVYGIGSVLSDRIVKFRNALGGFYKVDQLKEVYGIKEEVYSELIKIITIDEKDIKKININTASKDMLSKHPYIKSKLAQTIINYRNQHGAFKNVETLTEIKVIDREILLKIEPYLEF